MTTKADELLKKNWDNLITFFGQYYQLHGEILSVDKAFEDYGVPKELTTKALASKEFREALEERGIIFERLGTDWTSKSLTPLQLLAAESMLDLVDSRSQKKKLQDLGIETRTWSAWLRDPVFKEYLQRRAEQLVGDNQHEAHTALIDKVRSGDVKAIAYFNELTGRHVQQRQGSQSIDVQSLIISILEIIDVRVTDSSAKLLIADDLKRLIARNNVAAALTDNPPVGAGLTAGLPVEPAATHPAKELL